MTKPLRIGIDIRDLQIARTGTKTYLEELCIIFKNLKDDKYEFFFFDTLIPIYSGNNKIFKMFGHFRYQFWKQISLPVKATLNQIDILFCTDNVVPYLHFGYKTVPVFHDAFFFETPEHFNKLWLKLIIGTAIPGAKRSPIVITPSIFAREQIHKYTQIPIEKMPVIYEGPKSLHIVEKKESLVKGKYILHVGIMNKRKNIPALIKAFKKIKANNNPDLRLVLVGKIERKQFSDDYNEIHRTVEDSGFKNDIIFTGYLSDEDLAGLYRSALMYVFPSLNEGFGIPVLEAFQYKLPVLVSNNTSLPEVGGNAVLTFNPFDFNDIAEKIQMVLQDEGLRKDLINKGIERLKYFSWEKAAQSLLSEFEKIR
ncbi:glycosyltransferase family 1 protein [Pedobacter jejuensis]|uniref:Glycosyltransferase family 1 protein n=2 Tax=Pedobacter jejuensis TaxID=1268550 RepID=A0A3N0C2Z2_9SPHI|nr:glycosyltransferase family 1 protein [Pedobacter jejuensis]